MADFDIRDIAALKVKLQIIEKLVLADWILIILSMYYDWGGWITCLIVIQIILYIYKSKLRKQLKQIGRAPSDWSSDGALPICRIRKRV